MLKIAMICKKNNEQVGLSQEGTVGLTLKTQSMYVIHHIN